MIEPYGWGQTPEVSVPNFFSYFVGGGTYIAWMQTLDFVIIVGYILATIDISFTGGMP
jgi:hypothetical protein